MPRRRSRGLVQTQGEDMQADRNGTLAAGNRPAISREALTGGDYSEVKEVMPPMDESRVRCQLAGFDSRPSLHQSQE